MIGYTQISKGQKTFLLDGAYISPIVTTDGALAYEWMQEDANTITFMDFVDEGVEVAVRVGGGGGGAVAVSENDVVVQLQTSNINFKGAEVSPGGVGEAIVEIADRLDELKDTSLLGADAPFHGETLTYDSNIDKWVPVRINSGYDFGLYLVDPPEHLQKVFRVAVNRNSILPRNMLGSRFVVSIPAQEIAYFRVYKNNTLLGNITFPAGAFTGQCTDINETQFFDGDILTLETNYPQQFEGFSGIGLVIRMSIL